MEYIERGVIQSLARVTWCPYKNAVWGFMMFLLLYVLSNYIVSISLCQGFALIMCIPLSVLKVFHLNYINHPILYSIKDYRIIVKCLKVLHINYNKLN